MMGIGFNFIFYILMYKLLIMFFFLRLLIRVQDPSSVWTCSSQETMSSSRCCRRSFATMPFPSCQVPLRDSASASSTNMASQPSTARTSGRLKNISVKGIVKWRFFFTIKLSIYTTNVEHCTFFGLMVFPVWLLTETFILQYSLVIFLSWLLWLSNFCIL